MLFNAISLNFKDILPAPSHDDSVDTHQGGGTLTDSLFQDGDISNFTQCGGQALNERLCPNKDSGCHNVPGGGYVCLCMDLKPIHELLGCERGEEHFNSTLDHQEDDFRNTDQLRLPNGSLTHTNFKSNIELERFGGFFTKNPSTHEKIDAWGEVPRLYVIAGLCLLVMVIILVLLFTIILTRNKFFRVITSQDSRHPQPPSKGSLTKCIEQYVNNPNYHPGDSLNKLISQIEISREKVYFSERDKIGEGAFGRVYRGVYNMKTPTGQETTRDIAIKVLKSGLSIESQCDFEREIEILSSFDHPNIVKLLGIFRNQATDSLMPSIVFEYMGEGDLAEFLRSRAPRVKALETISDDLHNKQVLQKDELIWISAQIANGMRYLAEQHFVHRDLATRNCLVGDNLTVKISDFGMSRDIYTCDYYKVSGTRLLPVRWMSPESILYGKFTLESDVWSFGVVLWEIFTHGKQPYYGHSNEQVVKLILQGILLIPPDDCPDFIYKMMATTWKTEPKDRTNFADILDVFMVKCTKCKEGLLQTTKVISAEPRYTSCPEVGEPSSRSNIVQGSSSREEKDPKDESEEDYMQPLSLEEIVVNPRD